MSFSIEPTTWQDNREALSSVRTRVFVEEQAVPAALEWDDCDDTAYHWLATADDGAPIGTARMLRDGHIGRMAVVPAWRGRGVGSALLAAALRRAREDDLYEAYLYAQTHAVPFYERAGFQVVGEPFMDANIPHLTMRLQLAPRRLLGVHGGDFAPPGYADAAAELIAQAGKQLRILSADLDPTTFGRDDIIAALSALARKSRFSDIRVLVLDNSKLVGGKHGLLALQRRLSSSIRFRRPRNDPVDIRDNLIIADLSGILVQSIREPEAIRANFNNRPVAQNYIAQFDDLWERAEEDPELRQLEI